MQLIKYFAVQKWQAQQLGNAADYRCNIFFKAIAAGMLQTYSLTAAARSDKTPLNLSVDDILKCVENNSELLQMLLATVHAKNA